MPRLNAVIRIVALLALVALLAGAVAAQTADAAKKLAPPRSGAWKILSEETGQAIGHFTVTKQLAVTGLSMTVPEEEHEEGDEAYCGGDTLSIPGGRAYQLPISHFAGSSGPFEPGAFNGWVVAVSTGSIGGGTIQPAEAVVVLDGVRTLNGHKHAFHDRYTNNQVEIVLSSRKGKRKGFIDYRNSECDVPFLVKQG